MAFLRTATELSLRRFRSPIVREIPFRFVSSFANWPPVSPASGKTLGGKWGTDRGGGQSGARGGCRDCLCSLKNRFEGGGTDRHTLSLPDGQDALIEKLAEVNPRTIVVLNGASAMVMPWLDRVAAVLHAYYPGQEGGAALARILCGDISPSGRLPISLPRNLSDLPAMSSYPGNETEIAFKEELYVGYRHYVSDAKDKPLFPFGFGLTYSKFAYENLELSGDRMTPDESLEVSVTLTNTGERTAAEVVQLYVGVDSPTVAKPKWELRRFRKVKLMPGESETVSFSLGIDDISYYCPKSHCWTFDLESKCRVRVGPHCLQGLAGAFELAASASESNLLDHQKSSELCTLLSNRAD